LHVGAKHTARDLSVVRPCFFDRELEQTARQIWRRSSREAGPRARVGIGRQRELRHQQQPTLDIGQAPIHASRTVIEDAVVENPLDETPGVLICIRWADANQGKQSTLNRRGRLAGDVHLGFQNSLYQCNQWVSAVSWVSED